VTVSTIVHQEKDWAFVALCDDGSLWLQFMLVLRRTNPIAVR
jgi:hypothetical protein